MWWGPEFAFLGAKAACGAKAGCENITQADISKKFGVVMAVAGLLGMNFSYNDSALHIALKLEKSAISKVQKHIFCDFKKSIFAPENSLK